MDCEETHWLLLVISLPVSSATPRMRIWRALKALGCVALRDGAYLLPSAPIAPMPFAISATSASAKAGQPG
jgi:hypothetical protein